MPKFSEPLISGLADANPRLRQTMNRLARSIDQFLNGRTRGDRTPFVLLVRDIERRCSYISNAERDDVIALLREQLTKLEAKQ